MKKLYFILVLLFISTFNLSANDDVSLYINGLESVIQKNTPQAKESFLQLIQSHPNSDFKFKASELLFDINNKVDNSGIVPFYLGNLAVLSYSTVRVLDLLEVDQSSLTIGITGLTGVGLGIGSSYLLSKDYPISSELYSRIITNQTIALGNFLYLQGIVDHLDLFTNFHTEEKVFLSSQLITLNSSLFLSYFELRDKDLKEGKGIFGLQSYLWSNFYYWLGTLFFDSQNITNKLAIGMTLSDIAFFASRPLWDKIQWSATRSGLVSVGGLGGALIGYFANFILEDIVPLNEKTIASIVMGTTVAGKALTTYLTRNLDSNKKNKTVGNILTPYPIITANNEFGVGFVYII